jgi:hypothetical protein
MTSILSAISIITYLTKYVKLEKSGAEEKDIKKAPTDAGAFKTKTRKAIPRTFRTLI